MLTTTPALRGFPGSEHLIWYATMKNPHQRLTTPTDVAMALTALARPETQWMTGNIIGVDGGEFVVD